MFQNMPPVLAKAFKAAGRLRYSGERTVIFRRGSERRKHVEYVLKDGPRIRLEFPDDSPMAGQVVVENGQERRHFFPALNEIHIGPAMHDDSFEKLRMFIKRDRDNDFKMSTSSGDTIAGVRTTQVEFKDPRGNVAQRLWIDERTGMILKRELYDAVGGVVGAFEFSKVNFSPVIQRDDFQIVRRGAKVISPEELARRLMRENGMVQAFLTERGYKLMASRVLGRTAEAKVLFLTYETGKAPLSLVQVKGEIEPDKLKRFGGRMFKSYSWQNQGRSFVLIGDMPVDALQRLSRKVEVR